MFYKNQSKSLLYKIVYWILPVLMLCLVVYAYQIAANANPYTLAGYKEMGTRFIQLATTKVKGVGLWQHILASLYRVCIGAVTGSVLGIIFGVFIGRSRLGDAIFGTIFNIFRSIPGIAWVPLIIFAFGIGEFPKYLIVFIACFKNIATQIYDSIRQVDQQYIKVGRMFGANEKQELFDVVMPCCIPSIFVGIQSNFSLGWKVVLAAEMMGASLGMGALVMNGWAYLDMAEVMICVVIIAIVGSILSMLTKWLERLMSPWNR